MNGTGVAETTRASDVPADTGDPTRQPLEDPISQTIGADGVWPVDVECSPPTTKSGLPKRVPVEMPVRRVEMVVDPVLLRRVVERLRRLQ